MIYIRNILFLNEGRERGAGTTKKFVGQYAFFSGSFPRGRMKSIEARPNSHLYVSLCNW
uniref:Uncharacterized protein n=1 Tax=Picea glauca TaxID=3330 RepID=A0A101M4G2_PICGL|nr:hypothetical protein ABT39_MTgene568 [Picea glauca]